MSSNIWAVRWCLRNLFASGNRRRSSSSGDGERQRYRFGQFGKDFIGLSALLPVSWFMIIRFAGGKCCPSINRDLRAGLASGVVLV